MARDARLLFGPLATTIFALGTIALPAFTPGYDAARQTVSEIGEEGSPMRWPFAAVLSVTGLCLWVFAAAIWRVSRAERRNPISALFIAWMGVAAAAIGLFAFPHDLHNVFGVSQLVAYQAPFAFTLAWWSAPSARVAARFSLLMYALLLVSLAANLWAIQRDGAFWEAVRPYYGLMQRSLFACFFLWAAGLGWLLWKRPLTE